MSSRVVWMAAAMCLVGLTASATGQVVVENASRDHVRIEHPLPGGGRMAIVEGADSFAEAAEGAPPAREPGQMPAVLSAAHKARLAVLPAIFSQHFKPIFNLSESLEVSGALHLKTVFTREQERRMEMPSLTLSLMEAFVGSRKFDVLERVRLDETLKEIEFGESDYADPSQAIPMGLALNAEYVVLPEIELLHLVTESRPVPYVDTVVPKLKGKMIARIRVVETSTTRVVAAAREEVAVELRLKATDPFTDSQVINLILDLYDTTSLRLVYRTLETIYPVRLLNVEGGQVFVNRGEGAIRVGDEFEVYALGVELLDPDTGELLGSSERRVALLRVTRVSPRFSEAEILEGEGALGGDLRGYLCRETADSIAAKKKVSPRALQW